MVRLVYAFECLSYEDHVVYSFCRTDVLDRGRIAPWQLDDEHDPVP